MLIWYFVVIHDQFTFFFNTTSLTVPLGRNIPQSFHCRSSITSRPPPAHTSARPRPPHHTHRHDPRPPQHAAHLHLKERERETRQRV